MKTINHIQAGSVFGKLTTTGNVIRINNEPFYECKCACGKMANARSSALNTGGKKSCGCARRESCKRIFTTHGHSRGRKTTRAYNSWAAMIARCANPKNISFKYYGARGISVCERWATSFEAFLEDMGNPPIPEMSLDRIDVNGNYEKSNCRWATVKEQARNRTSNRHFTISGVTKTFAEWCEVYGIDRGVIKSRLKHGWDEIEAITHPFIHRRDWTGDYTIDGTPKPVADWAKEWGICFGAAKQRIIKLEKHKAISTPLPTEAGPRKELNHSPDLQNQS